MADNVVVTAGTGTTVAADEVVDGTLGTVKVQFVKLMDGTLDGSTKAAVGANGLSVDVKAIVSHPVTVVSGGVASGALASGSIASGAMAAGSHAAGAGVDGWDLTQGAIADAAVTAGATGSLSAKLRAISRDIAATQYTEDAAAAADPVGGVLMAVRRDTLSASEVSADGDNIALKATSKGKVHAAAELYIGDAAVATGSGAMGTTTPRVALATDSPGVIATAAPGTLSAAGPSVTAVNPSNYETVAASQTAQALGATGATGDFINGLLVIPATTSPGNVLLLDNATSITVFTGGATSVSNLVPFFIPLGMTSVSGAWKVTTGSNVSCIGVGKFT